MGKETIFIVEDEPLISRLAQVNLEHAGYTVKIASNGVEAFEALQSGKVSPDLLLLDISLPYMDGFELINRLRGYPKLAAIPIVIMTARAHDKDFHVAQSVGASRYLTKPINPSELVKTVGAVLAEERAPDSSAEQS